MKKLIFMSIFFILHASLMAARPANGSDTLAVKYNAARYVLLDQAEQAADSVQAPAVKKKSVVKAALMSAIIPGAGEAYAGKYWKATAFIVAEATLWTVNYMYNKKGEKEDDRMRAYGEAHWSEQRYWSNVYSLAVTNDKWEWDLLNPDPNDQLSVADIEANINLLRKVETAVGYTHSLPHTRTQQYYEMIYKYAHQFGNGWDDVYETFGDWQYYNVDENLKNATPNMIKYRSLRNQTEDYYVVAKNMVMLAMVNHLISVFDAAITVKKYNKEINYSFHVKPQYNGYDYTNTYGLNIVW